jgi:U3 small nucleolar RNA-associated protein 20
MAKMVLDMDLKYLADVIREVAITLTEGYKLHVRSAMVHSILLELLGVCIPPTPVSKEDASSLPFDNCTAALVDLIQEDYLFGTALERRESKGTQVRYVKEAEGSKSIHSIELLCRMIAFKPSPSTASSSSVSPSSTHCVVSPLLERLRLPDVDDSVTIRKIR